MDGGPPIFGAYSMGGGFAGTPKENQDNYFVFVQDRTKVWGEASRLMLVLSCRAYDVRQHWFHFDGSVFYGFSFRN
jgi:hypothetical protein